MTDAKTIVFGLDGAHFELIEPWIERGHLPTIARLVNSGVTADLQSVLPPVTSPNWKAYATGKNPGKIGIFWWENIDVNNRRVYYPSDRKHQNVEFWELLSEEDSVGVLGVPTTYPPKEVGSFLISGPPDAENDDYTHPSELQQELENKFDYRVKKDHRLAINQDRAADEIHELIDSRYKVAKFLLEREDVNFLQVTTFYLNSLHHYLWDSKETLEAWQIVDKHLKQFYEEGYNIVLMSDHGSTSIDTVFHLNSWLEQEGYLELDRGVSSVAHNLGITKENVLRVASKLRVKSLVRSIVPSRIRHRVPSDSGEIKQEGKTEVIDWDKTQAVASGQGVVYITADGPAKDSVRTELMERFQTLTTPDGLHIARTVHNGDDVYHGQYEDEAPDIVIEQTDGIHIPGSLGRTEVFSSPADDGWLGENKRSGLFIANGPSFSTGKLDELSILDLAPMFLHLHGRAIPKDMDGEVPMNVFKEGSEVKNRSPTHCAAVDSSDSDTDHEDEDLRDRLGDLGYIE